MKYLPFHEALEDCSRLAGKVPRATCLDKGDFPVIGQGKQEVEGFTNDSGLLFRGDLPVILFGDHTAAFKFINCPFARGADGTKLFRPRTKLLDEKFTWHFLQTVKLPDTGYDRKTKYLENLKIPLPPLEEQRRIAAILDKANSLYELSKKAISRLETLSVARLEQLIDDHKEITHKKRLEELCANGHPITYGILQPGPDIDGGIPYVRPSEIKNSKIETTKLKRTSPEIAKKYCKSKLKQGDILLTIVGTIGEVAMIPSELEGANITQSSARISIDKELANPSYISMFLKSNHAKRQIERDRLGAAVQRLNLHHVRDMEILCLPMQLQKKFADEITSIEHIKSLARSLSHLSNALFESLKNSMLMTVQNT